VSSIPAVLAALKTLGDATLAGWQGINGPVGSVTTTAGNLFLVGDEDVVADRQFDSMGIDTTSETYTVPIIVNADVSAGTDQQTADTLALDAYMLFERAIREYPAGPNLGLAASGVLQALPTGEFRLMRSADDQGRHAAVRFFVAIYAQNT
jgi:hypothetical protein